MNETVKIEIQTIPSQEEETNQSLTDDEFDEPNTTSQRQRRRRAFAATNDELAPYPKKLSMSTILMDVNDERRKMNVDTIKSAALMNFWWQTCVFSEIPQTPMWVGRRSEKR
ncbi:hypothetical protein GHT06_018462 [Daphnia sinensis]|uniref:Uncharacterized protein n=1 Tax=Daphnia sinensis TaxID=1820382 RepID=A0AAD5L496_9CRUS|nr:hypothetical protein GHT06_018462 [Daphnia sinensis]